jgi:hypothetical protein
MQTEEQKQKSRERKELMQKNIDSALARLAPCPFCGDHPFLNSRYRSKQAEYNAECDCFNERDYSYSNSIQTPWFRNIDLVIDLWNKRKIATQNTVEGVAVQQATAKGMQAQTDAPATV